MSGRQCKFKNEWKEDPQFRDWIGEVSGDVHRAYCKKSFDVGNMGISALKSHARGRGHVKVAGQLNSEIRITHFMIVTPSKDTGEGSSSPTNQEPQTVTVHEAVVEAQHYKCPVQRTGKRLRSTKQLSIFFKPSHV